MILAFYQVVFAKTSYVAGWNETQYLFFVGCYFAMSGVVEMMFLENLNEFSELVRTGDLDFLLLKPVDEQFLISLRKIDWGTAPNVPMGAAIMALSLWGMGWTFDPVRAVAFLAMFGCGVPDLLQLHAGADLDLGLAGA